jgi:uncharacterized protein YukE
MDETSQSGANAAPKDNSPPLAQNEYVQELFSILQNNGRDMSGLTALLGHVEGMENYIKRAEDKISEMKSQLAEMKEVQNHPVKTALQNAIKSLENKVAEVKERLGELKSAIAEGCKSAVQAFKEKGISALDKLSSFFHVKGIVKALDKSVEADVKVCDRSIAQINDFATQYHSAGRAIKNMGRVLIGKEPIDAKKEAGKLARAMCAPYKAEKAVALKISELANAVVQRIEQLETTAADNRENRAREQKAPVREEREPTLLEEVADAQQAVDQRKLEMPTLERVKDKAAAL